jgi:uncharacterized protein YbjT (DUF2867 family)
MTKKTALVLGATGLVGRELIELLSHDTRYKRVTMLVRRAISISYDTDVDMCQVVTDFEHKSQPFYSVADGFRADHIYVCLGTTIKKAGSEDGFRRVDFDLVFRAALMAQTYHAKSFVWISSVGADPTSSNFYLRVKGQLEQSIFQLKNFNAHAVRPSLLLGNRAEKRFGESAAIKLAPIFTPLMVGPLRKYRPIEAIEVARQMIDLQHF